MSVLGRFLWYELMTTDTDGAIAFYGDVVGWGSQSWEDGETPYTMWLKGEMPVGGIMLLPEEAQSQGAPPHWLPYIGTPDVDETVAKAIELGATVYMAGMDIPDVGRIAVLADPQGAVFAVYTPVNPPPEETGPPGTGNFSWHELAAIDREGAFAFYQALFGWETTDTTDMGEAGVYQMYGIQGGGVPLGGMFTKPDEMPGPAFWLCYVDVDDVTPQAERVGELGGRVLVGPMEVPGGGMIAQCLDPQGAAFAIHSRPG
jgi:predicted enzyme related to lactoylglutathione lyase